MNKFRKGFYWDDDPNPGGDPPADPPKDPPKDLPKKDPKSDPEPKTIPYERFKEVNQKYTVAQKKLDDIKTKQKEAEDKKLKDKEDYKTLYEKKEAEAKEKDTELLRLRVAQKKGLPADLVDRLKGETEQELEADADKLLEFVDISKSPGLPPRKRGGSSTKLDIGNMSPKEIRENADKLLEQANSGTD